MATKYISLEEAAARLKMTTEQLKRLRSDGEIRGFADRGTWKFRDTDVEEYARKTQADSDPDFPAISDDDFFNTVAGDAGGKSAGPASPQSDSDSDVRLIANESSAKYRISDEDSDSDVQLVDSSMNIKPGSELRSPSGTKPVELEDDSKLKLQDSGAAWAKVSDSDIRIVQSGKKPTAKSDISPDSDIQINESSPAWKMVESSDSTSIGKAPNISDVKMRDNDGADSDVKLIQGSAISKLDDSDSDVRLIGSSMKIPKIPIGDSDIKLAGEFDKTDSDVQLHQKKPTSPAAESGITLADDSGLTIQLDEESSLINQKSGFRKSDDIDSGISLAGDSGISLELAADSGISLMDEDNSYSHIASDSGISLEPMDETGFTLPPLSDDDMGGTIPMLNLSGDDDMNETNKTIELSADDDVFALRSDDDHDQTSVIMFDEDDANADSAAFVEDSALYTDELSSDDNEESVFDLSSVDDDMNADFDADDLELSDDMIGEDDSLDVFEADEGDFEDGFESGESQPGLSSGGGRAVAVMAASAPWGAGTISLLSVSALLMTFCTLLMFDVVRSLWALESHSAPTSMLLDLMASIGL